MVVFSPLYGHCKVFIIYNLSDVQIEIFNNLLLVYLLTTPLRQLGDFLYLELMYAMVEQTISVMEVFVGFLSEYHTHI